MHRKYNFVYITTNLINKKFYIGIHSTDDLDDGYLGSGKSLKYSIKKYGKENFKREFLEFCDTKKEAALKEEELVNTILLENPNCMNLRTGGTYAPESNFGSKRSDETKLKMSKWKRSAELGKKISEKLTGRVFTKEHREAVSKSRIGIKPSDETRSKMSQAKMGIKFSDARKKNMKYEKSESHKLKMRKKKPTSTCSICNITKSAKNITAYHNDKCSINSILQLGRNYTGNNFAKDHKNKYKMAISCGYLDQLNFILKKKKQIKHSKERTLEIAFKYNGKNFRKDYNSEYIHSRVNLYMDELKNVLKKSI